MKNLLITTALILFSAVSHAEQWQVLGTRPMGMGGAFVAVAQGPIAQYWNPAGLVKSSANVSGMEIPVGGSAEFTGDVIKNAGEIGDLAKKYAAIQSAQTNGGAIDAEQMAAYVKTLALLNDMNKPGKGALIETAGGVNFKFSKVALAVNNFTAIGVNPFTDTTNIGFGASGGINGVDFAGANLANTIYDTAETTFNSAINIIGYVNIELLICGSAGCLNTQAGITDQTTLAYALINQAAANGLSEAQINASANTMLEYAASVAPIIAGANSGAAYSNNTSALNITGASFTEIAAGYAWDLKMLAGLSLGANLKLINGRTATTTFRFLADSDTSESFKLENTKSSWQPAADLGLLWDINKKYPRIPLSPKVGLTVRNINNPKFDTAAGGDYDLDRQARIGVALWPAKFWTIALDMDITKNKTALSGFESRQLALGTEINVVNRKKFNIPLRGGIMKNLADSSSKMAYTLGTGLNLLYMHFDVAGAISADRTTLDGEKVPTKAALSASFGLLF